MLPVAASCTARSVMKCPAGSPVVVIAVRVHVPPARSNRQTAFDVAAKSRVPLANSMDLIAVLSRASCALLGTARLYGFEFVGIVFQLVPQSVVSQTRCVP